MADGSHLFENVIFIFQIKKTTVVCGKKLSYVIVCRIKWQEPVILVFKKGHPLIMCYLHCEDKLTSML